MQANDARVAFSISAKGISASPPLRSLSHSSRNWAAYPLSMRVFKPLKPAKPKASVRRKLSTTATQASPMTRPPPTAGSFTHESAGTAPAFIVAVRCMGSGSGPRTFLSAWMWGEKRRLKPTVKSLKSDVGVRKSETAEDVSSLPSVLRPPQPGMQTGGGGKGQEIPRFGALSLGWNSLEAFFIICKSN